MNQSLSLTLQRGLPGRGPAAAAAAWLRRTNAALSAEWGVPVTNLLALRLLAGTLLVGAAFLVPAGAAGWGALCLVEGARQLWRAAAEYAEAGGCADERTCATNAQATEGGASC